MAFGEVGRPKCMKSCCTSETIIVALYNSGLTSDEIGRKLGRSDEHIIKRLHILGAKIRPRGNYKRLRDGTKRHGVLWQLDDEELFKSRVKDLMSKYHLSFGGVMYVRSKRRKEEASKRADEEGNNKM